MRVTLNNPDGRVVDSSGAVVNDSSSGCCGQLVYTQVVPSKTWTIKHNKGLYPPVIVTDNYGRVVIPDVYYNSSNTITLQFYFASTGKAVIGA